MLYFYFEMHQNAFGGEAGPGPQTPDLLAELKGGEGERGK